MKLIRDKIPLIAKAKGEEMICHVANPAEYRHHLQEKLLEEVHEFLESGDPEELADILEVVRAVAQERGMNMSELYRLRDKKRKERGGFEGRIIWQDDKQINYGGS
jgi:predicted house-cleaning noncanonical NTP pyrophosphatase (MazG superfamily)